MADEDQPKTTRRQFLKTAAVGVAAAGVAVAVPATGTVASGLRREVDLPEVGEAERLVANMAGPIVAYVRNPAKGEIVLMVGEDEVVRRDFGLVLQLARLARQSGV